MTDSVHALSGAYVVDALDDDERAAFERHLPDCRDCTAEVAELREAAVLMADAVAVPPPAALRGQVLAGIRTVRPLPPETSGRDDDHDQQQDDAVVLRLPRRRFRLASMAVAAAVVALLAFVGVSQPWNQGDPDKISAADRVLAADDVQHVKLAFPDGSTATLFRSDRQKHAVLVTEAMKNPPEGRVYELWLRHDGRMVPAGLMTDGGSRKVLLKGDAATADAAGITVEPDGGSKSPTTAPIAMFEFEQA